ncbi:MAG: dehydrogenase [Paludibacteraceae bacterium]|nr:dehydrogenase [Paludibacteraceae bacterium]
MADNYLENHYEEWLKRKTEWEKKGKPKSPKKKNEKSGQ